MFMPLIRKHGIQVTSGGRRQFFGRKKVPLPSGVRYMTYRDIVTAGISGMDTLGNNAYEIAISMCGNSGQETIINDMGVEAFIDAAHVYMNNNYDDAITLEFLTLSTDHPEAVSIILEEAARYIADATTGDEA